MEISVKNFRCWHQKTVTIAAQGVTLLSGPSGIGKSSILEALLFLITGKGRNIISQGKSTCEVKAILADGTSIIRKKRPNITEVKIPGGDTYQDAAAQGYLTDKFTDFFEEIGFLGQTGKNLSFVLKGPSDKLAFIEKLAFHNMDINRIKIEAYNLYKEYLLNLNDSSSKLELLEEQLSDCKSLDKIKFPIKTEDKSSAIIKLKRVHNLLEENIPVLEKDVSILRDKKNHMVTLLTKREEYVKHINTVVEEKKELVELLEEFPNNLEKELQKAEKELNKAKKYRKAQILRNKVFESTKELEIAKEMEIQELKKQVEENSCWEEMTEEKVIKEIARLEIQVESRHKIEDIKSRLEKLSFDPDIFRQYSESHKKIEVEIKLERENLQKAKLAKDVLICPTCDSRLRFINNTLEETEKEETTESPSRYKEHLKKLIVEEKQLHTTLIQEKNNEQTITNLENNLSEYDDQVREIKLSTLKTKLNQLREYVNSNQEQEKRKTTAQSNIDMGIFSKIISNMEVRLRNRKERLKLLEESSEYFENLNEESLDEKCKNLRVLLQDKNAKEEGLLKLKVSLKRIRKDLEEAEKEFIQEKMSLLPQKIKDLEHSLANKKTKFKKLSKTLIQVEKYLAYKNAFERQKKLKEGRKLCKKEEQEFKHYSGGADILRRKIKESESKCLLCFVESLEAEVQVYIDEFFHFGSSCC